MGAQYRKDLALRRSGVTLETLEKTPERALKLLRTAGNNRVVRGLMQGRGYTSLTQAEGFRLLGGVVGMGSPDAPEPATDPVVAKAIEDVDPHDEELVEITDASLKKDFPEQNTFLLTGISPAGGMAAVLNVDLYLQRRNTLLQGTGRAATHDKDLEAVKLLEERGITSELCTYLAERVKVAKSAEKVDPINEAEVKAADEAYIEALVALREWYVLWSRIARVTIKRRDYLMQMGLAHRSTSSSPDDENDEDTEPEPEPAG